MTTTETSFQFHRWRTRTEPKPNRQRTWTEHEPKIFGSFPSLVRGCLLRCEATVVGRWSPLIWRVVLVHRVSWVSGSGQADAVKHRLCFRAPRQLRHRQSRLEGVGWPAHFGACTVLTSANTSVQCSGNNCNSTSNRSCNHRLTGSVARRVEWKVFYTTHDSSGCIRCHVCDSSRVQSSRLSRCGVEAMWL